MPRSSKDGFDRRAVLSGLVAVAGAAVAPATRAETPAAAGRVVRLSRASFPAEEYEQVRRRLEESQRTLLPALRELRGILEYHAAIDRESSTMINVSVWRSLEDAEQMQTLAPMLALAESFEQIGVRFERPIANYETLWGL
jgi:hypothetical protein